jgi:uncharacterized protein
MRSLIALFGRSPFGPLAQHAGAVLETVQLVRPLLDAFVAGDADGALEVYERISALERRADETKNDIREHLPKSLLMPVDRGDVLRLLKEQDRIADRAEDVAVLLTMRRTPLPDALRQPLLDLADACIAAAEAWCGVAADLPTLEEASFAGPEVEKMMAQVREISRLEWAADRAQADAGSTLFAHETEIDPVSVILWLRIFRTLSSVADHAENTADLLRVMLAKR